MHILPKQGYTKKRKYKCDNNAEEISLLAYQLLSPVLKSMVSL
jgi:hypothetical protein